MWGGGGEMFQRADAMQRRPFSRIIGLTGLAACSSASIGGMGQSQGNETVPQVAWTPAMKGFKEDCQHLEFVPGSRLAANAARRAVMLHWPFFGPHELSAPPHSAPVVASEYPSRVAPGRVHYNIITFVLPAVT